MTATDVVPASLDVVRQSAVVIPAPVSDVVRALQAFEDTCRDVLRREDWQQAPDGRFVVRTGWLRLMLAYSLSDSLLDRIVEYTDKGNVNRVTTMVEVTAENGRHSTGVGVASLKERCGRRCPANCNGRRHWTHSDHDISATSHTRALSRAICNIVGGAPSDDLMNEDDAGWDGGHDAGPTDPPPTADPETGEVINPADAAEFERIKDECAQLSRDESDRLSTYLEAEGIPTPIRTIEQARQVAAWLAGPGE